MRLEGSRINIPGTSNVRDLGGYPAGDGRTVAPSLLYRAEALAHPGANEMHGIWDEAHQQHYAVLGIRTVIDLRSHYEVEKTPTAWGSATGGRVIHLPIAEGGEGSDTNFMRRLLAGEISSFNAVDLAAFYIDVLERRAQVFGAAMRIVADPASLPTLAHCSAGKDRTGLFVALLLEVLGTPRDKVVEDYTLTGIFRPNRVDAYAAVFAQAGVDGEQVRALFETPAMAMQATLEHVDQRHGGAVGYLTEAAGLTEGDLASLRDNLLA